MLSRAQTGRGFFKDFVQVNDTDSITYQPASVVKTKVRLISNVFDAKMDSHSNASSCIALTSFPDPPVFVDPTV